MTAPLITHNTALRRADTRRGPSYLAIIGHVVVEPRVPMRELARRVGMSAPAVTERILRLREAGMIRREWIEIDPEAIGFTVLAYVGVRPMPGALPRIAELAQRPRTRSFVQLRCGNLVSGRLVKRGPCGCGKHQHVGDNDR
jgi:DNA-binding Lrp family transcriptional regulator